jgi:hypothetical protein
MEFLSFCVFLAFLVYYVIAAIDRTTDEIRASREDKVDVSHISGDIWEHECRITGCRGSHRAHI